MAKKSLSSKEWLREHFTDPYVKKAQAEGYRSRAVYKLLEIQARDRLMKPGMLVIDLGAAPGGWSQVAAKLVKPKGKVIALDILEMPDIDGVQFIRGDFASDAILNELNHTLAGQKPDLVLSDIAPNLSGSASIDIPRSMYLSECVLAFAISVLKKEGALLMKVFQGEGFQALLSEIKNNFSKVFIRKPKASRPRSREVYILAKELKNA